MRKFFVVALFLVSNLCLADWIPTDVGGAPDPRKLHTAIWTGTEMLVWGGIDSPAGDRSVFAGGGRYNPKRNSWSSLEIENENQKRFGHTSVWTGTQMLAWGGAVSVPLNTGIVLTARNNRWKQTSLLNAPTPRYFHQSVWTGKQMLVWGGQNLNTSLSDGGAYDPRRNQWTKIPSNPNVQGRFAFASSWSGTGMFIFGGFPSPDTTRPPIGEGAIYFPATKTWKTMSTKNAPIGRAFHSGVWTGSKWIIWGGLVRENDFPRATNDGAIYDPSTDTWTQMSMENVPSPRSSHSAIWTGNKMVVFGGVTNNNGLNDGGIYDPANNTWTRIPAKTLPGGRFQHTAVWTGSRMIVWGGVASVSLTEPTLGERNDGGIFSINEEIH